jgi:hypothetical protein
MENILLISIGTGKITLGSSALKLKNAGVIGWVMKANLIDVMMSSTNNSPYARTAKTAEIHTFVIASVARQSTFFRCSTGMDCRVAVASRNDEW